VDDETRDAIWAALQSEDPDTLFARFEKVIVDVQCEVVDRVSFKLGMLFGSKSFNGDIKPRLVGMVGATLEEMKDEFRGD